MSNSETTRKSASTVSAYIEFSLNLKIAAFCQTKKNNRITEAYQVHLGGWLNLEMALCEIDCELEFMNPFIRSYNLHIYIYITPSRKMQE